MTLYNKVCILIIYHTAYRIRKTIIIVYGVPTDNMPRIIVGHETPFYFFMECILVISACALVCNDCPPQYYAVLSPSKGIPLYIIRCTLSISKNTALVNPDILSFFLYFSSRQEINRARLHHKSKSLCKKMDLDIENSVLKNAMSRYKNNSVKWKNEGESGFFLQKKIGELLLSSKIVMYHLHCFNSN